MVRIIIGSLALITVIAAVCNGQLRESIKPASDRATAKVENEAERKPPWAGTVYLAGGWGRPQGVRIELGGNAGKYVFGGLCFGIGDTWSRDPDKGTFGVFLGMHFTGDQPGSFACYLMGAEGGTIAIFGGSDRYRLINAGAMISLTPLITLRPELSVTYTSQYVRGGNSIFGSSPLVHEEWKTRFGANLIMEMELRQLF